MRVFVRVFPGDVACGASQTRSILMDQRTRMLLLWVYGAKAVIGGIVLTFMLIDHFTR